LRLRGVDWREAFSAVLAQHQLGMERTGRVIVVDTLENLAQRAERRARVRAARVELEPTQTVLIPVRYASAQDLLPIVRSMLSSRGTAAVDARTNTLIVTDVRAEQIRDRLVP
jgi:type IV pilus assembly protein PilQ